jgi:hypothetical protein
MGYCEKATYCAAAIRYSRIWISAALIQGVFFGISDQLILKGM